MNTVPKKKVYKNLGFEGLETVEIVSKLNTALATYQVFFHKLQNFHWNVVGSDFFDVHDLTEELYNESLTNIDVLAERIRVFGKIPNYRLSGYLRDSLIAETSHDKSAEFMMDELISDIQSVIETMLDIHEVSSKNGDVGTAHLAEKMTLQLETYHWKLTAWNNKRYEK